MNNQQHHRSARHNHLHVGPPLANVVAAEQTCCVEAAEDRQWFLQNPGRDTRERPATASELEATGHPPGTQVLVLRGPYGTQMRCFLENS